MQNADRGAIVHLHCEEPCTMYMGLTNVDIEEIYIENTVTKLDKCGCSHICKYLSITMNFCSGEAYKMNDCWHQRLLFLRQQVCTLQIILYHRRRRCKYTVYVHV